MVNTAPDVTWVDNIREHAMKAVWSDLGTYCLLRPVSTIVQIVQIPHLTYSIRGVHL